MDSFILIIEHKCLKKYLFFHWLGNASARLFRGVGGFDAAKSVFDVETEREKLLTQKRLDKKELKQLA